jgi:Gram-negative bacterial TonB protein C-terminal
MYLRNIKILILTVCVATQSHGQQPTADEDRRTVSTIDTKMPVPIETTVELPIGTKLIPRVVLLLHLDATGHVLEAKVAIGEEPFASIALDATKRFQFVPALKNGVPTECRFLFEISWQIPRGTPSPTST